jgi:ABC-type transport system substrate-binding protein
MRNKKAKRILYTVIMIVFVLSVFTETRVVEAGNPGSFFSVSVLYPVSCSTRNQWAPLMVEELPKIGIEIDVADGTGWAQISPRTWGHPGPYPIPQYSEGGFDILFVGWGWGLDLNMEGLYDTPSFVPNGDNFYQYSRPEMDWAIGNYSNSYLVDDRVYWAKKIQEYLYEDVPAATIIYPVSLFPMDPNFNQNNWDGLLWDTNYKSMENWTIPGQTEFTYATPADFEDFHPHFYESVYDAQWLNQIYIGLFERALPDRSFQPKLVTSYNSADGITYNIQLNPDAVWADGYPLNASDVEFSYHTLINSSYGLPDYSFYSRYITNQSVVMNTHLDLTITFNQSYIFQDSNLGIPLIPKHIWKDVPLEDHQTQAFTWASDDILDSQKIIGAGPYYLEDYDGTTGTIHLKRNEFYDNWTGITPNFEDIYFKFWSNKEGALAALATGDVDMVDSQFSPQIAEIPEGIKYELVSVPGSQEMAFNTLHPIIGTGELCPISSPESGKYIRRAISHIIPRDKIVNEILDGLGDPGVTPWPISAVGADDTLEPFEYNITRALRYMELAGYDVPDEFFNTSINLGIGFGTIMGILSLIGGSLYLLKNNKKK